MISRSAELFDQHDLEDRVREIFHEIDTNGDGMIDEEELTNALEKLCFTESELSNDSNKQRILSEFAKIDGDNDGAIDFNEFVLYYNNMLSFQMHEYDATSKAGTSVDLWSRGDMSAYRKLVNKLLKRKKISQNDYDHIEYMFKSKFCLLDLKMAISKYRRSESILPLRRFLDKCSSTIERRKTLDDEYWNLDPKEILLYDEVMEVMVQKHEITQAEKIRVDQMLKNNIQAVEIKAAFFEYEMNPGDVHLLKKILELNEYTPESKNFDIAHQKTNVHGVDYHVPVMKHNEHSKEQFMGLMSAANVFYASPDVEFDPEMIMQLKHVVDMLHKRGFLNKELAIKAKQCITDRDSQCIYALYKYDTDFERLNTYLKFKMNDKAKEQKIATMSKRHQHIRQSLEADRLERRNSLEVHQLSLGGIDQIKKSRESALSAEMEAANRKKVIDDNNSNDDEGLRKKKKAKKKIPRWKQLYDCKFESYKVILERERGEEKSLKNRIKQRKTSKYVVQQG